MEELKEQIRLLYERQSVAGLSEVQFKRELMELVALYVGLEMAESIIMELQA